VGGGQLLCFAVWGVGGVVCVAAGCMSRRSEAHDTRPTNPNPHHSVTGVKAKREKLFGFGHRVYKNFDPRAVIIRKVRCALGLGLGCLGLGCLGLGLGRSLLCVLCSLGSLHRVRTQQRLNNRTRLCAEGG